MVKNHIQFRGNPGDKLSKEIDPLLPRHKQRKQRQENEIACDSHHNAHHHAADNSSHPCHSFGLMLGFIVLAHFCAEKYAKYRGIVSML